MVYPVPAIKGGAVEGLVELIIRMNEKYHEIDLTVISMKDESAEKEAVKYKNTKFVYIDRNKVIDKIFASKIFIYLNKIFMKLKGKTLVSMPFVKKAIKAISRYHFDKYILEGGGDCYNFGYLSKVIPQDKLYVHFHGEVAGERAIQNWFGKCITVSNYIARRLICNGKVDSDKVYVLPNCFDTEAMKTNIERDRIRSKYNIGADEIVYIYWGRLLPEKGVYELINAYKQMKEENENTRLLILGSANFGYTSNSAFEKKLEKACMDEEIREKIIFTGFIPHDELGSILAACDIGIIPSIWDDPAPLTVFEGLSKGLPIIASAVGGIPEIIRSGENGILIDWTLDYVNDIAQKMIELKNDKEKRAYLSANALESIKNYTPEKYYDRFMRLME